MGCFRLLFEHLAWIEHQFLSGIRDPWKAVSLWGMMRGVGGVRKSEHQNWLAKGLGLGLLCWGFKGVQEKIPSESVVTRQLRWKMLWRRLLTRSHKSTSIGPSRSCWNSTTSALQQEEITSKGTRVSCVYYQWKCPYEKSLETYLMILVPFFISLKSKNYPWFTKIALKRMKSLSQK